MARVPKIDKSVFEHLDKEQLTYAFRHAIEREYAEDGLGRQVQIGRQEKIYCDIIDKARADRPVIVTVDGETETDALLKAIDKAKATPRLKAGEPFRDPKLIEAYEKLEAENELLRAQLASPSTQDTVEDFSVEDPPKPVNKTAPKKKQTTAKKAAKS